jgi:hypothetical protein
MSDTKFTQQFIDQELEKAAKATKRPWFVDKDFCEDGDGIKTMIIFGPEGEGYGRVAQTYSECGHDNETQPNAEFIISAANNWEDALMEIKRLREALTEIAETNWQSDWGGESISCIQEIANDAMKGCAK